MIFPGTQIRTSQEGKHKNENPSQVGGIWCSSWRPVTIYVLYIRSILEQSCHVWHSSLTLEITTDLERVQKNSLKIILQQEYSTYEKALEHLNIDSLFDRRNSLCLKFAKKCLKTKQVSNIFPLNNAEYNLETRNREKYKVTYARTDRLKNSAIPFMHGQLNNENQWSVRFISTTWLSSCQLQKEKKLHPVSNL